MRLLAGDGPRHRRPGGGCRDGTTRAAVLLRLKGIGPEFAAVLCLEALFRSFSNRREVAAYGGLTPSPWQSGGIDREQGIAKAGNPRLRKMMIQLAWMWIRHQPGSAISRWFAGFVGTGRGRVRRIAIVAVARKLLVALWRFATQGIIPEGAVLKAELNRYQDPRTADRFAGPGGRWSWALGCKMPFPRMTPPFRAPRPRA